MLTSRKSKLISMLVFTLIFAALVCCMGVTVFAHDDHDHGEGLWATITEWMETDLGQIIGYCVAGVVLVAIVVCIFLWIPKKDKKDKKAK